MQLAVRPEPVLTSEDELHWLALRMAPGLGTRKAGQLNEIFRTPQAVFRASRSELEAAGLPAGIAQSIASGCAFEDAVTQQQAVDRRLGLIRERSRRNKVEVRRRSTMSVAGLNAQRVVARFYDKKLMARMVEDFVEMQRNGVG